MKLITLLCSTCLLTAATTDVKASDFSINTLLDMDIESLSQLNVTSASKHAEAIADAPSIMSVVTADEIERYGAVNLHDILNRVPSLQVLNSTANPNNALTLRAGSNQHYPNRILFLIDGRPVRDSYGGHLNYGLFLTYPVSNIKQIEVIRGPGSVLYGTNAYVGVVNIKSKDACNGCAQLSSLYGSYGRKDYEGSAGFTGDNWSFSGAFKTAETKGERFQIVDEASTAGEYRAREEGSGLFLKGHYDAFNMTLFQTHMAQSSLGIFGRFPESASDGKRLTFDLGYDDQLFGHTDVSAHITYNRVRGGENTDAPELNRDDLLIVELSSQTRINDQLNFSFGGFFEHQDGVVADRRYQQHLHNIYSQFDWMIFDDLKLVTGIQMNDSELFKADYSPRASLIYRPFDNWGGKLLYGEAFRSSSAIERELSIPNVIVGDINTAPETIETLEAQIFYSSDNLYAALSGYRNRIEDIIGRISNPSAPGFLITNTGEEVYHGVELEGQYYFNDGWHVTGSLSWQEGKSDADVEDPTFSPNLMAKFGVSYKALNWSLGVFDSWFGDPENIINGANPSVLDVNQEPDSYHLISANLDVDLNSAFGFSDDVPEMRFTLYGENLIDEEIYFPEYNRRNINSFPIDNSRAVYGRLTVKF